MLLVTTLLLSVFMLNEAEGLNLEIQIPSDDAIFCAKLQCSEKITGNTDVTKLVNISVYKVDDLEGTVLLASVPDMSHTLSSVKVSRILTSTVGELILFFNVEQECQTKVFVCEMYYINKKGEVEMKQKVENNPRKITNKESTAAVLRRETDPFSELNLLLRVGSKPPTSEVNLQLGLTRSNLNYSADMKMQFQGSENLALPNEENKDLVNLQNLSNEIRKKYKFLEDKLNKYKAEKKIIKTALVDAYYDAVDSEAIIKLQCSKDDDPSLPERLKFMLTKHKQALCDTKTEGGGWILIQRRIKGTESFQRTWNEYKNGFGELSGDFWLGNYWLWKLTFMGYNVLRFDMTYQGISYFAEYMNLKVENEENFYRISFSTYRGNASDQFYYHNGMKFTTKDKDNDEAEKNCSHYRKGGWWYKACQNVNVNALWRSEGEFTGVFWETVTPDHGSLDTIEIKIRVE
ncbi:angiopoietin-related protein 7-like [Physella acuta]|uniref:angiopoietin-related protein 7-like n=1 Tax=Physella acuta TaxID=109671 RepID=UPI0027DE5764|nr:angiopoietin-related protein 7-like [Physella acuta]